MSMRNNEIIQLLEQSGIKPTANRILVLQAIADSGRPLSLADLEAGLLSLEKSSIFRVLTLLLDRGVLHTVEDGRGIERYELCVGGGTCSVKDMHAHFYCESCHLVFCFESCHIPVIDLPEDFAVRSVNYILKGICPNCRSKQRA